MDWILDNITLLLKAWGAIVVVASVVVKLTKSTTDDEIWLKILKFLELLALNAKPVEKK